MKHSVVKIDAIELDTTIQCRASIDTGIVNEYADRISEGDEFPPVVLFVQRGSYWIGDGWHRILAAKNTGADTIKATVSPGGRVDALKHALGANAVHGHRRTNADKRRAVEIALKEFPKLSARAVAEMCGVSDMLVGSLRQVQESCTSDCTGRDGKQYHARQKKNTDQPQDDPVTDDTEDEDDKPHVHAGPPCVGMQFARIAVMNLENISKNDTEREQAFRFVKEWISENE